YFVIDTVGDKGDASLLCIPRRDRKFYEELDKSNQSVNLPGGEIWLFVRDEGPDMVYWVKYIPLRFNLNIQNKLEISNKLFDLLKNRGFNLAYSDDNHTWITESAHSLLPQSQRHKYKWLQRTNGNLTVDFDSEY